MIRSYRDADYDDVSRLLSQCGLMAPTRSELMSNHSLVWDVDHRVIGFVWVIRSPESATAYIDLLCVDPDYRFKEGKSGRSIVALLLMKHLLAPLASLGVTRIVGVVDRESVPGHALLSIYARLGMMVCDQYSYCYGQANEIYSRVSALFDAKKAEGQVC